MGRRRRAYEAAGQNELERFAACGVDLQKDYY